LRRHRDASSRDLLERNAQTLSGLVHSGQLVVVAKHVTYVAKDINSVSVPVQCPPNWARVAMHNDTFCGTYQHAVAS